MPTRRSFASFILLALLASCGTDNQPTAPGAPLEVPFNSGALSGTLLGAPGAVVTTSGPGALITGIPGQFTSLRYRGSGNQSSGTSIYFSMAIPQSFSPSNIWRIGLDGKGIRRLTSDTQNQRAPSVSPDGSQVVFFQQIAELGHSPLQDIIRIQSNGSNRTKIGTSIDTRDPVAWTPRADSFYFFQNDPFSLGIWRQPNRNDPGELLTDQAESAPSLGVLDGVPVMMFSLHGRVMTRNLLTGDTAVFLADSGITRSNPKLSPDSRRVVFSQIANVAGAPYELRVAFVNDRRSSKLVGATQQQGLTTIPDAVWEQDSRHLVATFQPGPNMTAQLYEVDADAFGSPEGLPRRLITTLTGTLFPGISLGPTTPPAGRPLIGPGAPFGDTASGIVFGMGDNGILASVLAFGGADPDSVELTAETGLNSNAPVLSVSLRADRLTSLAFVNDPVGMVTQVIDSTSGATGALLTFNASDGTIALILPFTMTPGEAAPTVRDEGATRVFRGHFLAVIEPDGARRTGRVTEVTLDPTSRKVTAR